MTSGDWIRLIGLSHLLQPPLTLWLSAPNVLDLRAALTPKTTLGAQVVLNMAFAAVGLPTALGLLLALYAEEALQPGAARALGLLLAAFWCWRLYRQLFVLRPLWPRSAGVGPDLDIVLTVIFVFQGPGLALLLL